MMFNPRSLFQYYFSRYKERTDSLFLDGLVGGMFFAFLLDDPDKCDDKVFVHVFFYIGLAHFLSKIIDDLDKYSSAVGRRDGVETVLERWIARIVPFVLHLVKLVQFPLLFLLTYHVIRIVIIEHGFYTHDQKVKEENLKEGRKTKYCEANTVHIAVITVIFQYILGILTVFSWTYLWAIDRDDDEEERIEEQRWKQQEAENSKSVWGCIKRFILVVGMESFFDTQVSAAFLTLAMTLPKDSCNIDVMSWFLTAGVVATLTDVINLLRTDVQTLAMLDGIINKAEHRLLTFLRMVNFPLFIMEFVAFISIFILVVEHYGTIVHDKKEAKLEDGSFNPEYCENGPWRLMIAVIVIYSFVMIFRVFTIITSLWDGDVSKKKREIK